MSSSKYNFKSLLRVPSAKDFIDVILSKTQRKTPTVVHKGYKISRIRAFYMRKVRYTQQNFHDAITQILEEFPRLDEIHPFYADLINVLYSRDHYKLALAQLNTARSLIDNLSKDYVKLLKFGDSLYRCKELKRAAMGRMVTLIRKLGASLGYLEEVRKHLSRLPSIDPSTRTLMITGYPNVGKSSFINKVSRANVEVQPYAFTTKSLFVGHFDYKYMRWQCLDTPGILDHPLEERNTIEMQAITALAHLQSTVLFFVDISESCGYTIKQQVSLFNNIKPLFANKPLLIIANKTDLRAFESLDAEEKKMIDSMVTDTLTRIIPMSNQSEEGITTVVTAACDMLLAHRVEKKLSSKRIDDIRNQIHVAMPVPRDEKTRSVAIPDSVREERKTKAPKAPRKLLKELEAEGGGPGVYDADWKTPWVLDSADWKFDIIPEIMEGKNIADFIDPEWDEHMEALEKEEDEQLQKQLVDARDRAEGDVGIEGWSEEKKAVLAAIRTKKKDTKHANLVKKTNNKPKLPRTATPRSLETLGAGLASVGLSVDKVAARVREGRSRSRGRKRDRGDNDDSERGAAGRAAMEEGGEGAPAAGAGGRAVGGGEGGGGGGEGKGEASGEGKEGKRGRSSSRAGSLSRSKSRVRSKTPADVGLRDVRQKQQADRLVKHGQKPLVTRASESDRHVFDFKPKHLFSGKRKGQHTASHR